MAKYYGNIGYVITKETVPGVWPEQAIERPYYGDVISNRRKWQNGTGMNDDVNVSCEISIVADAFAFEHFQFIRYAVWNDTKWKVQSVEVQRPRINLMLGDVYNG